jgi:hypothetical protein
VGFFKKEGAVQFVVLFIKRSAGDENFYGHG